MPNRILKDFTASEKIDKLSADAEVFFIRLIMKADDFGIYLGNPKLLKSALFPLREIKDEFILKLINELVKAEISIYYEVDGKKYIKILEFGQRLRAMRSKYPEPDENALTIDSSQPPEKKRNETKRKETETEGAALMPWNSDEFAAAWSGFKEFLKVEKRKPYKSVKTETSALSGLVRKSKNNETAAITIIQQSIENNWQGLFELKNQQAQQFGNGVDGDYMADLKKRTGA